MSFFRPLVLLYHTVSDSWHDPLAVRNSDFERQLNFLLVRGFRGGTSADVLSKSGDGRLLHVTFDDGYRSVAQALPVLRRLGLPCTVFICSDYAVEGRPLAIAELINRSQGAELATLDWQMLRSVVDEGMVEIGSHTSTHAHLVELSDSELSRELRDSKIAIEDNLGRRCETFAYPFGEQDSRVRRAVKKAGYAAGFAAPGVSTRIDPFQIPRTGFWRDETARRQAVKTRFLTRVVREHERRFAARRGSIAG